MEDRRNILRDEAPFDYRILKDNKAQINYHGKMVKILKGKEYDKLLKVIDTDDAYQVQLFLAKVTGNFKRGNEKMSK